MKNYLKRMTTFILAILMLVSVPLQTLAEVGQGGQETPKVEKKINYDENPINDSGFKEGYINNKDIDVKVAKPKDGSQKFIEGPDIPAIYTMKAEYKIQRGDNQINNYQPYEASVGADLTQAEKDKINQTIMLPDFDGYTTPTPKFDVTHASIMNKAKEGKEIGKKEGTKTWTEHKGLLPYIYHGKQNTLKVKHVFQSLEDQNKYGPMDGQTKPIETIETGLTGSIVTISPLESDKIKGYKPETNVIETQMPEHTKNYVVEYRYNRKHFDVHYDTQGGSPIATRTIYYGQRIPTIPLLDKKGKITTDTSADPTYKVGSIFQGWKPSIELKTKDGKKFEKDKIIKDKSGNPIKTLDANLIMPADNVTFTAVWKDKEKADYAVQFWAEKADHADNAGLEKYDYIGTHVYKNEPTGKRPDLDKEPVKDIVFPDLDKARLGKIWGGEVPYLNKFYVYNQDLTHEQNKDPKNVNLVKSVDSTGETVYNIYYDRQVYDLYFTKSNVAGSAFYPEISKDGKEVGKEGNPYHFKARFNQSMVGLWPDDVKEVRGFDEGNNSLGWLPNLKNPKYFYRDTPPYRLSANLFIDFPELKDQDGYASEIDLGNGQTKPASITDLSFGIDQNAQTMPHHIDFWLDDFDGEQVIDYDLYTIKSDVNRSDYNEFLPPDLRGFTPKNPGGRGSDFKDKDDLEDFNDEREEITPFPEVYSKELDENDEPKQKGKLYFMKNFPGDDREFDQNGYLKFEYSRNKYPLRFNYDPSIIRDDSYFNDKNQLDTFYEFPLKALSPEADTEKSYKTGNPKNLLDNPKNLEKLGLTDLVFKDTNDNNKLKVKRPDNLSDQMVFKGWALDPAGTILVRDKKSEKMPSHAVNLYAKWGEPDSKWKVTIDPNGGYLSPIKAEDLTKTSKTIQEGDIGQEEEKTYPIKEKDDGKKQVFTFVQRQQLNKPTDDPKRLGYDFLGWEWVKFNEDGTENKTYSKEYKVPELYSFGNDIVSNVYLRAIWVKNDLQTVMAYHHILDKDLKEGPGSPESQELPKRRKGYFAAALGSKQGSELTLVPNTQWEALKQSNDTFKNYYNEETGRTNNYFQVHEIKEPIKEKQQDGPDIEKNNPENDFHFFYMPYRKREYKVNYLDERCKADVEKFIAEAKDKFKENYEAIKNDSNKTEDQKKEAYRDLVNKNSEEFKKIVSKYSIIAPETVINGKRHYDARNYRHIPGWTLADNESPQQQLFFDVDESTNEFLGINGTGLGEVFFFYQDARVIEVKNPEDKAPKGYVRVTFKADKGGSFGKDAKGDDIKVLYYDVIKGLKSDSLPVPQKWEGLDNLKDKDKNYITPDNGKNFVKWDNKPLLNKGTILQTADNDYYVFTAYFDWSGLSTSSTGLVRTEAFKDPDSKWTNDFAPKIEDLKKQLVWKEKDKVKDLPAGTEIKLFDEAGTELTTNDQVYDLVTEKKAADKDELVRTVNIKAKVTFPDKKDPQELDIPITVYKNVYEALNVNGDKPLFLKEAEGKEAKDGGLKDILKNNEGNRYIRVTIKPNKDFDSKDDKVYYVNPNAWVDIPKIDTKGDSNFTNWTADKKEQNDESKENGNFDFAKRHKFTKDTIITPVGAGDVVEQEKGKDKPDVPKSYVKVIVKTTDKATDKTAFEKTFWVNPTKEVTIGVTNPTGKTVAADATKPGIVGYTMNFFKWETEDKAKTWEDKIVGKFEKDTTILAKYSVEFEKIKETEPTKGKIDVPKGKIPTADEIKNKLTPPEGKTIKEVKIVKNPDVTNPGESTVQVIVEYTDGSSVGTSEKPLEVPVKVHEPIVKAKPDGSKPEGAMENYVKVTFTAGTGGTVSGDLVYYVSPEVEVDMTESAGKIKKTPNIGYISGSWDTSETKKLKDTFKLDAEFTFNFTKNANVVEETDDPNQTIPEGYKKVTFKTDGNGKVNGKDVIIYYVNPTAGITLKVLGENQTAGEKQLAVPKPTANKNFVFKEWQEDIDETTPITSERVHVAIFKPEQISLTYDKGGEDVTGDLPATVTVNYGETVGIAEQGNLKKPNAVFAGWKLDEDEKIYQPGAQVKLEKARTATAQWNATKHNVKFVYDDGRQFAEQEVEYGKTATKPTPDPTQAGKVFMGWKENENDTIYFNFDTPITADKTLVAQWQDPVQNIDGNTSVDNDKFIKVTFKKGDHGTLRVGQEDKDSISYKVAKELTFLDAFKEGKTLPEIIADQYFKVKEKNGGWDKALRLDGQDIEFTAQYEQEKIVPVDPTKDNETLINEKPKDMVLVIFKVDPKKAFMIGDTKFYVKKSELVNIETPKVYPLTLKDKHNDYVFKGWSLDTVTNEVSFTDNTVIDDSTLVIPNIRIRNPRPNARLVIINELTGGATGYLEVTRGNKTVKIVSSKKGTRNVFDLSSLDEQKIKAKDKIKIYAEKDGVKSEAREYRVR